MFPFWTFQENKKLSRLENVRAFKIVFYFLLSVAVSFLIVTYFVFE